MTGSTQTVGGKNERMITITLSRPTHIRKGGFSAYECKDDKVKHMIMTLAKAMLMYNELEGYHYSMDTYIDMTEAYSLLGMKGPQ
jgi:hypothetical protein